MSTRTYTGHETHGVRAGSSNEPCGRSDCVRHFLPLGNANDRGQTQTKLGSALPAAPR